MATQSPTVIALDQVDPWGFQDAVGPCLVPRPTALEIVDEVVEDADLAAAHALSVAPAVGDPASPRPTAASRWLGGGRRESGWPFQREALALLALFLAVIVAQAFYLSLSLTGEASADPRLGDVVLSSHPSGAEVLVDGRVHGVTPVVLSLVAGRHDVEVRHAGAPTEHVALDVTAGQHLAQHIVLAASGLTTATSPRRAGLRVETGGAAARIAIDGVAVGAAPFVADDLVAGDHTVRVQFARGGSVERRLTLPAGDHLSLVVEAPAAPVAAGAGPVSGWLQFEAPFEVQVFEAGRLLGSSASDQVLMTAGTHALELVNAALGYRALVRVAVTPGRTARVPVDVPRVPVHVNALPWAEVAIDGQPQGETPIANLQLAVGTHRIHYRHPDLGERTDTVTVRAGVPNRLSADLRR